MHSVPKKRDWLAFERSDQIGFTLLNWAAVVFVFGAFVLGPTLGWIRGRSIEVSFLSDVKVPELDRVGTTYSVADYAIVVAHPHTIDYLLTLLPGLLAFALFVAGAVLVQRVMDQVSVGDPFAPGQVGRLRGLAALLLVGAPVHFFLNLSTNGAILTRQELGGLSPAMSLSFPVPPVFVGLVIAMLAEGFRTGGRLRADVEGLV